jgi:hypothetical protein
LVVRRVESEAVRTVEIISHCWQYSRVLNYQLSSLVLNPPKRVVVRLVVYYSLDDSNTQAVVTLFAHLESTKEWLHGLWMKKPFLLNRSIGRNMAARHSTADLVWFCDCDYFFGPGCLDALADVPLDPADPEYSPLYFPRVTYYNKDHANGDGYARRAAVPDVYDIDPADFIEHRSKRAIGGIQIVPGDVARAKGYCPDISKWQTPTDGDKMLFGSDVPFRRSLGTGGKAIDIPNCYRIRQTTEGVVDTLPTH